MIALEGPHMAINDSRTPNRFHMWCTWDVDPTVTVQLILNRVVDIARQAPGGKLKNLVFRCHGAPAFLYCGAGIGRTEVPRFVAWREIVEKIWLSACEVARHDSPHPHRNGHMSGVGAGDGHLFCSELAQAVGCHVVAPTERQVVGLGVTMPYGKLDTFEGLVLSYDPAGRVSWSHRYPSTFEIPVIGRFNANWN